MSWQRLARSRSKDVQVVDSERRVGVSRSALSAVGEVEASNVVAVRRLS